MNVITSGAAMAAKGKRIGSGGQAFEQDEGIA